MSDEKQRSVDRASWWNWALLTTTAILSTTGVAVAFFPVLRNDTSSPWPWVKTELALLTALSLVMIVFSVYLTFQQRRVSKLRQQLDGLEHDRSRHAAQHYQRLMGLLRVSRIMGSESDMQAVFDGITATCHEMFESMRVSLMLLDKDTRELVVQSVAGAIPKEVVGKRQRLGQGISGWVAEQGQAMVVGRDETELVPHPRKEGVRMSEAMVVPIIVRDELVGVLNVGSSSPETRYHDEDLQALQVFAENAGACVRHRQQAQWMRQTIQKLQGQVEQDTPAR